MRVSRPLFSLASASGSRAGGGGVLLNLEQKIHPISVIFWKNQTDLAEKKVIHLQREPSRKQKGSEETMRDIVQEHQATGPVSRSSPTCARSMATCMATPARNCPSWGAAGAVG
jgi:hypothetical protein